MILNYLFSNSFKKPGWFLFSVGILLGILHLFFNIEPEIFDISVFAIIDEKLMGETHYLSFVQNNVFAELASVLAIVGGILVAFSKEKYEDEFISKIRLESLVWATYLNYGILVLAFLFVYEMAFLWVLVFNMFTVLLFFMLRFNWAIYQSNKTSDYEE